MDRLEVYGKLLRIKPWFQRPVVGAGPPIKVYKTYREVQLVSIDGGASFKEFKCPNTAGGGAKDTENSEEIKEIIVLSVDDS